MLRLCAPVSLVGRISSTINSFLTQAGTKILIEIFFILPLKIIFLVLTSYKHHEDTLRNNNKNSSRSDIPPPSNLSGSYFFLILEKWETRVLFMFFSKFYPSPPIIGSIITITRRKVCLSSLKFIDWTISQFWTGF